MEGSVEQDDPFDLAQAVARVEDWEESTDEARKLSERDRDYYDNKQLSSDELKALRERGQPDVVFNKIRSKVNYLTGLEVSSRTDPKAMPRTPNDEDAAEAATDALRFVEDSTDLDTKLSAVWENMIIEGYGAVELVLNEPDDIEVVHWPWDRIFYDPHSRKHDGTDSRYLGGVVWMDEEQALESYPEAREAIETTLTQDSGKALDDRPKWKRWTSGKTRKRVKVVQMYYLHQAQWYWCHFTKGGKLAGGPVPFVDEKNRSWCPMFMQSAYVDRENNRYGEVRAYISPQDELNKRRSKSLHLLTMRQTKAEKGAVDDVDAMKTELSKPDGHVEINPGFEFDVIDTSGQIQGNFEMMQQAMLHMEQEGANAALMGKQGGAPSGKAIQLNQTGGQVEISPLMDKHMGLKKRVYVGIWNMIRQFKKEKWWVRVTDNEDNVRFVGFNRPVTMREAAMEELQKRGIPPEIAQAKIGEIEADPNRAPLLSQVVRMANVAADMNMDITIENVPDVANMQQEQFDSLVSLAPAVTFPPQVYIKMSSLRNKRELLDELQQASTNPAQDKAADQAFRKGEAEIKKLEADAMAALAKADQTDAQTGQIVNPQIIEANGAQMPTPQPQSEPVQPGF